MKGSKAFLLSIAYDRSLDGGSGSQPSTRPAMSQGPPKQAQPQASPCAARQCRKVWQLIRKPGEGSKRPLSRKSIGSGRPADKNGMLKLGMAPKASRHRVTKDGKSSMWVRGSPPSARMQMNGSRACVGRHTIRRSVLIRPVVIGE